MTVTLEYSGSHRVHHRLRDLVEKHDPDNDAEHQATRGEGRRRRRASARTRVLAGPRASFPRRIHRPVAVQPTLSMASDRVSTQRPHSPAGSLVAHRRHVSPAAVALDAPGAARLDDRRAVGLDELGARGRGLFRGCPAGRDPPRRRPPR